MADTLELSIHVSAKPETVFRYLSDPELFKHLSCSNNGWGPARC